MESPSGSSSASASPAMAEPPAVQTFTDADSYKAAKDYMLDYAQATKSVPGVRYYRLINTFKNKVCFWALNGGADVKPDHQYVLDNVGRVSEICMTGTDRSLIRNVVIDGATFYKEATFNFPATSVDFRNCTWENPASSIAIGKSIDTIAVTNPTGHVVIKPAMIGSSAFESNLVGLGKSLILARMLSS